MLKEVPHAELFKLKNLFDQMIREMNGRLTAAEAVMNVYRACGAGYLKVFCDNVDDPSHCLVVTHYPGMVDSGFLAAIVMLYSVPQARTTAAADEMFAKAEEYARAHKCETLVGSSWKYRGARGIDAVWTSRGFELQETTFVKLLR